MSGTRLAVARCEACALKEQQIRDLRVVIGKLQQEARRKMGRTACGILDALQAGARLTAADIAKVAKLKSMESVKQTLWKMAKRGLVRRAGWRDIPGKRFPDAEYEIVGAREVSNGKAA